MLSESLSCHGGWVTEDFLTEASKTVALLQPAARPLAPPAEEVAVVEVTTGAAGRAAKEDRHLGVKPFGWWDDPVTQGPGRSRDGGEPGQGK